MSFYGIQDLAKKEITREQHKTNIETEIALSLFDQRHERKMERRRLRSIGRTISPSTSESLSDMSKSSNASSVTDLPPHIDHS